MKRLLCLCATLLTFATSGFSQTQTDTIRLEVKPTESTNVLNYVFTEDALPHLELEWVLGEGTITGKFRPADSGWTSIRHTIEDTRWIYIYYNYEQQETYSFWLSGVIPFGYTDNYDLRVYSQFSASLDVSGCTALNNLYIGEYCKIGVVDAAGCTSLTNLECSSIGLTSLDVSGCTALTSLYCCDNDLTSLNVSGCTKLKTLMGNRTGSSSYNYLYHYLTVDTLKIHGASMETLAIGKYSKIKVIDAAGCTSIENLSCDDIGLTELNVNGCSALTSLSCESNQLTNIDVSKNTALTYLSCRSNQLTNLDASKNTTLTYLSCESNQLTNINVNKNTALTYLSCRSNQLTNLDVSKNTALTSLSCGSNQLTNLDVSKNTALAYLSCGSNQLTTLDLSGHTTLKQLYCEQSSLKNLNLTGCTTLSELSYQSELENLNVSGCTALEDLICNDNQLTSLDVSGCITLDYLDCYNNQLTTLDVNGCTALRQLSCGGNHIPLSVLYNIYNQRSNWIWFTATQSDSITLLIDQTLDLSSERIIGQTLSSYELTDAYGRVVDSDFWQENRYKFQFHEPLKYTLKLQNPNIIWQMESQIGDPVTFTWHISVVEEMPSYMVKVSSNNTEWGTANITGNGTYEYGTEATVSATSNEGYRFVNWTKKNGTVFSTEATHTFKVTENLELTANFEKRLDDVETFTVMLSANNAEWGRVSISGDGTYEKDENVTITATPNEGYRFVNWTKDGEVFATEAVHTFAVTEDLELTANFEKDPNHVGNEGQVKDNFCVWAQDRVIYLSADKGNVQVYNALGQCLYSGRATAIPVRQSGLYIVRIGKDSYKVMVR